MRHRDFASKPLESCQQALFCETRVFLLALSASKISQIRSTLVIKFFAQQQKVLITTETKIVDDKIKKIYTKAYFWIQTFEVRFVVPTIENVSSQNDPFNKLFFGMFLMPFESRLRGFQNDVSFKSVQ